MDIELEGSSVTVIIIIVLLTALLLFGLVGKFVSPVYADQTLTLTPARWTAYKLQKQARKETEKLIRNAQRVQHILESDNPDPVEAMLVAQDIYADHQNGSSATAAARGALIAAAEATVRATIGEIPRNEAIAAFSVAIDRIDALSTTAKPQKTPPKTSTPFVQYLPSIQSP